MSAVIDIILFFIVLAAWLNLDIYEDYFYIIFDNRWHTVDAIFRVIMSAWVFYKQFGLHYWAAALCGVWLAFYWTYFDIGLNLKRGKEWDYVGNHAYLDKQLNKRVRTVRPIYIKAIAFIFFLSLTLIFRRFDL